MEPKSTKCQFHSVEVQRERTSVSFKPDTLRLFLILGRVRITNDK